MPANYALCRFGSEALRHLPAPLQRQAQRFRRIYNAGVHGQNLFFYAHPAGNSAAAKQYANCNRQSGRVFFTRACAWLKENPSEAGVACLYGLLAHYCLKSRLASLIAAETGSGNVSAVELEVELDRYLLAMDGKTPAHQQNPLADLKLTRGECVTLAGFFPPVTAKQYFDSYRRMTRWARRMAAKKRGLARFFLLFYRREFREQMMPECANHKCIHLDRSMFECYERALECYPAMARQLTEYREKNIPLGEDFDPAFV